MSKEACSDEPQRLPIYKRTPLNTCVFTEQMEVARRFNMFLIKYGSRLYHWKVSMRGPPGSPYERGVFLLRVDIPSRYPFELPKVHFATRIYHPNISVSGHVYMGHLECRWTTDWTLPMVLISIYNMLSVPYTTAPLNKYAAEFYMKDKLGFAKIARYWTEIYAVWF